MTYYWVEDSFHGTDQGERDKGAEAGGASPTEVPYRIRNAKMSQSDHFEGWA